MSLSTSLRKVAGLERVRYFARQLITADDMMEEQKYFREKLRRHNRFLHGWGVVCGLDVTAAPTTETPWRVHLSEGYALGPYGDEIYVAESVCLDLAQCGPQPALDPCEPSVVRPQVSASVRQLFVAIKYAECPTRPVRVMPAGCGCEESACEYSRVRDSFEIECLTELPASHQSPSKPQLSLCELIEGKKLPACPPCPAEPWVVLARVDLPKARTAEISDTNVANVDFGNSFGRRLLFSAGMLQEQLIKCCCETVIAAPISVQIQPRTATLGPDEPQDFTATVRGSTNTAVDWSVQEAAGGSIDINGSYRAPLASGTYHVVVTSQADSTKSDTATVTVIAAPISVQIQPRTATLVTEQPQDFTATVRGSTNTAVDWSVQEAAGGSIDINGSYRAPLASGTYHVVVTSQADSTKSDTATVTVIVIG